MKIHNLNDIVNKKTFLKKDINGREINIYHLTNVLCSGINLHYPNTLLCSDKKIYLPLNEKTMSLNRSSIYESMNMEFNIDTIECEYIYDSPVFFFVYNVENYYHFIYDTLPYLISYFELKKTIPNLKLLLNYPNGKDTLYLFVKEFLEILNVYDDIVIINENTIYKNVYISTSYTHDNKSNLPPRNEIYDFYQDIVKKVNNTNIEYPKRIYISRRTWVHNNLSNIGTNYTTRRKLTNENELVSYLNNNNIKEVFTENLSTIEKISMFNNAELIIGAIGGGIANVLFSKKSCKLITLVSPTFLDVNNRFKYSLDWIDNTYFTDTFHYEKTEYKKYMRVKYKNIIGEIEDIDNDDIYLLYQKDTSNIGWSSDNNFESIKVNKKDLIKLDNGLNSCWVLNLSSLIKIINNYK